MAWSDLEESEKAYVAALLDGEKNGGFK